jgi:hypothetical protein
MAAAMNRSEQRDGGEVFGRPAAITLAAAGGFALLIGLFLLIAVGANRMFQVDEVEHLHAAYNLRDGRMIYSDFWQGHPPLLYVLLVPLVDPADPVASYHRGRIFLGATLFVTIALCGYCGLKLGNRWTALLAAGLALSHTTLIERGIEVRPDGPLVCCMMAALAIELSQRSTALRRFTIQSLILGSGLLLSQKGVFPLATFALLWLITAWRTRRPRLAFQPLLMSLVPLAVALGIMAMIGNASLFVRYVILDATSAVSHSAMRATFGPGGFLIREGARNPIFVVAVLAGLTLIVIRRRDRLTLFTAFAGLAAFAALWLNPFPWPYVHIAVMPVLAVIGSLAPFLFSGSRVTSALAVIVTIAAIGLSAPRLLQKAGDSADAQFATLREVGRIVSPRSTVFDLAGLYFRPDAYPVYAMSGDMLQSYANGAFPRMVPELRRNKVACVLNNYRMAVLPPLEKNFIGAHFTHYDGYIFLPGADLSAVATGHQRTFEALAEATYRYDGSGAITVDGTPFTRGRLTMGLHRIAVIRASLSSRLIVDTPQPVPAQTEPRAPLFGQFD